MGVKFIENGTRFVGERALGSFVAGELSEPEGIRWKVYKVKYDPNNQNIIQKEFLRYEDK